MRAYLEKNKSLILFFDMLVRYLFAPLLFIESILKKSAPGNPEKILIVELWGIGDLVMMSAVLKPLRQRFPDAKITLLSKPTGRILFGGAGLIEGFIEFDFPWTRFKGKYRFWNWDWRGLAGVIKRLRAERFDLILDARGDFRNNLLSFFISAQRRIGYDWTGGGYFLTDILRLKKESIHRVDAWFILLNHIGIETSKYKPSLHITNEEENKARDFLIRHGIKNTELLVGIHPGAKIKSRCWPLDRFATIAEHIRDYFGARIVVFIEPEGYGEDIPIRGDFIKANIPLREMICLLKLMNLLICNDSAAMHIATAVDIKTLSIFGPGDYRLIGPYGIGHTIVANNEINCRPCFDYCKFDKSLCLYNISVEMVSEAGSKLLRERNCLN